MLKLGSNISALTAQRRLAESSNGLARTFERLSSGLRINRASDDAAGLAIASTLNSDARIYGQALRNVNDGFSVLSIAEGALSQLTNISIRQRELAAQSANGVYSVVQRRALHAESEALVSEFNRIVQSAEFNGRTIFENDITQTTIQVGRGDNAFISFDVGDALARTIGDGTFTQSSVSFAAGATGIKPITGDINGDGNLDLLFASYGEGVSVMLGTGTGSFGSRTVYATGGVPVEVRLADVNGDSRLDIVAAALGENRVNILYGNGNGTFAARVTLPDVVANARSIDIGDVNGDGQVDIVAVGEADEELHVMIGTGGGSFAAAVTYAFAPASDPHDLHLADVNGDGRLDILATSRANDAVNVFLNSGNGSFGGRTTYNAGDLVYDMRVADLNHDGFLDIVSSSRADSRMNVLLGNGDGTFRAKASYAGVAEATSLDIGDLNGDGFLDFIGTGINAGTTSTVFLGNGDGTFRVSDSFAAQSTTGAAIGDFNGDGANDIAGIDFTNGYIDLYIADADDSSTIAHMNLASRDGALAAMRTIDDTLERIMQATIQIGVAQSRLEVAAQTVITTRENYLAAASRIVDADIAVESAELVRLQILQQAGAAVLGQANQAPALTLVLLH